MEHQSFWSLIRERVCTRCIDGDGHGSCRLDPAVACPLQSYLPFIVQAVRKIESDSIDEYIKELRLIVCARCTHQTVSGSCALRTQLDCALDRYFPLVVQAIEEAHTTPGVRI